MPAPLFCHFMAPKKHSLNFQELLSLDDRFQAAEALGNVLYGQEGNRHAEFTRAFLDAVDDARTSRWLPPAQGSLSPHSIGLLLGAVWVERR